MEQAAMTERIEIKFEDEVVLIDGEPFWGDSKTTRRPIAALRQQQADIEALRAERDQWKTMSKFGDMARGVCEERDQLRAKLAEYERAPTVATIKSWAQGSYYRNYNVQWGDVNIGTGTELIARPAKD